MAETRKPEQRHVRRTPVYTIIVYLYWLIAKLFFFMRFEGLERVPKGVPCILMGNHQCLLDPVTLALCARDRELRFMGKKELFEKPVLGWIFRTAHGFPVDRGNVDMDGHGRACGRGEPRHIPGRNAVPHRAHAAPSWRRFHDRAARKMSGRSGVYRRELQDLPAHRRACRRAN